MATLWRVVMKKILLALATGAACFALSGGTANAVTYCIGDGKATYSPNGRYHWSGENYNQRWEGSPGKGEVRVYGAESGTLRRKDTFRRGPNGELTVTNMYGKVFRGVKLC